MSTAIVARHSSLSASDDRALASVFAAYTVAATLWLLFATAVGVCSRTSSARRISVAARG